MNIIYVRVRRTLSGLNNRPLIEAETKQFKPAEKIPVQKSPWVDFDDVEVEIFVKSFQKEDLSYRISPDEMDRVSRCSCPYMTTSLVICKHMFLVMILLGYEICYKTRNRHKISEEALVQSLEETDQSEPPLLSESDIQRILEQIRNLDADDRIDLETLLRWAEDKEISQGKK
ncbi:hypothetical protein K3495_g7594 [Podosphaera aphanis]|nr:hypothetical protein K3495_g7594 [Podosphaera aphanis]